MYARDLGSQQRRQVIRENIQVSVQDFPTYKSLELLPLYIRDGDLSFVLVVLYRPDSASTLTVDDAFFVDMADVLEWTSSFAGCAIVGDVNVHLGDVNNTRVVRFTSLLSDFGLRDIVRQPTHQRGHQLDVFITRTDQSVASVAVDPPLMSDHSLIVATFDAASVKQSADGAVLWRRRWQTFDYDSFASEFRQSELVLHPPSDVTELVRCYEETLATLLDKFVPLLKVRSKA